MADDPSRTTDLDLGRALVAQGLVTKEQFLECLSMRDRAAAKGEPIRLIDLLQRKGYLDSPSAEATIAATVKAADRPSARPSSSGLPAEAEAAERDPSCHFGKYVRVSLLGAGGMGEVWRAWDRELRRWVALKFLKGADPSEVARFEREAQTAAQLAHPNVAAVYDVGQIGGKPYIALQLIHGKSLAAFPRNKPRLLARLIRDAATALQYAHDQGVIHRDLKPHNLMVEGDPKDDASLRLFVMDFGLAKQTSVESSLSVSGAILGTPAYMPPEQARGRLREIDARSDVYSLGATLYELLADRAPFKAENVYELLRKVAEEDPLPIRRFRPKIDADLETIAQKCLEKDPARRYATARELAEDLERWLSGEAILAHPPSTAYRIRKYVARRKAILIPTAAALLIGLAFGGWAIAGSARKAQRIREGLALGRGEEKSGRLKEARDAYRSVLDLAPEAEARSGFDRVDGRLRATADAARLVDEGRPALDQARLYLYLKDANYEELARKVDQAQGKFEEAARLAPDLASASYFLAQCWEIKGWDDRAVAECRKSLVLQSTFAPAHLLLGRLLLSRSITLQMTGNRDTRAASVKEAARLAEEAQAEFRTAETGAGMQEPIHHELAAAYGAHARKDPGELRRIAERGLERFKGTPGVEEFHFWMALVTDRNSPACLEAVSRAIELRPSFPLALLFRASLKLESPVRKEQEEALRDLEASTRIHPRFAAGWFNQATLRQKRGELDRALADYDRALEIAPGTPSVLANRALAIRDLHGVPAGLKAIEELIRLDPSYAVAYNHRGIMLMALQDTVGAPADFEKAMALDPGYVSPWFNRGNLRLEQGNGKGAIEDFTHAISLDPAHFPSYTNRANAKEMMNDLPGALRDFEAALQIDAGDHRAWYGRGSLRLDSGDFKGAVEDFSRALAVEPKSGNALFNRGLARIELKDPAGAIDDFSKAIELEPRKADGWMMRGRLRAETKDVAGARKDLRKALELLPAQSPKRAQVQTLLGQLGADDF